MILNCPSCGSKSTVDDAKVPDQPFQARCASCGGLFRVDPAAPPSSESERDVPMTPEAVTSLVHEEVRRILAASWMPSSGGFPSMDGGTEGMAGAKSALVCLDAEAERQSVSGALAKLGYAVLVATDMKEAESKIDERHRVVVIGETFGREQDGGRSLLRRLGGLPPARRRSTVVTLISTKFRTGDGLPAFVLGADAVVSSKDLGDARRVLERAISGKEELYGPFFRAQAALRD